MTQCECNFILYVNYQKPAYFLTVLNLISRMLNMLHNNYSFTVLVLNRRDDNSQYSYVLNVLYSYSYFVILHF